MDKAEVFISKVVREYPGFDEVYNLPSAVYAWKGDGKEAAKNAEKALQLNPSSPASWDALGMYHARRYNYATALEHFLAACSMDLEYLTAVRTLDHADVVLWVVGPGTKLVRT